MKEHSQSRVEIAIYRGEVDEEKKFDGINFGALLDGLVTSPKVLAGVDEQGSITLDIKRTHEWELILGIVVVGSEIFLKGALTELGKQLGSWLADQVVKLKINSQPEIRGGKFSFKFDQIDDVVKLLKICQDQGWKVYIVFEPNENSK